MVSVTYQFLEGSSLHGLVYLGRPAPQRLFWTFILTLASALMVYYVLQFWSLTYEVLVMVENPHQDLEEVEFPAVTVCPAIKALKSKVHLIGERFVDKENLTSLENAVVTISLLKYPFYHLAQDFFEAVHGDVTFMEDEDIINIMNMVNADLDSIMEDCHWRAQLYPCRELFRQQMTHEGYCYSFNSKTAYRPEVGRNDRMEGVRLGAHGANTGLGFRLKPLAGDRLAGDPQPDLYSVAVDDGARRPDMAEAVSVPPDRPKLLVSVQVSIFIVEADETVVSLPERARGCSTTAEGDDRENAANDCMQNCRDSEVLRRCGCWPYLRIHMDNDPWLKPAICGFKHLSCLKEVSRYLRNAQDTLGNPAFPSWIQNQSIACSCLPRCSFTTYNTDFTEVPYIPRKEGASGTWVRVDYKGPGMKYARSARMNVRDVLVGSGSMASFLLGFSAVAVFDAAVYVVKLLREIGPSSHGAHAHSGTRPSNLIGLNKVIMFGSNSFYLHEYKDHTDIPVYTFVN